MHSRHPQAKRPLVPERPPAVAVVRGILRRHRHLQGLPLAPRQKGQRGATHMRGQEQQRLKARQEVRHHRHEA